MVDSKIAERHVSSYADLTADDLKSVTDTARAKIQALSGGRIPLDPLAQLLEAVKATIRSWDRKSEAEFRKRERFPDNAGCTVTIQAMVFGNLDDRSGTGIAMSRSPLDGSPLDGQTFRWQFFGLCV